MPLLARTPAWPEAYRRLNPLGRVGVYLMACVLASAAWLGLLFVFLRPGLACFVHPERVPLASSLYLGGTYLILAGFALWFWRRGQQASYKALGLCWSRAAWRDGGRGVFWGLASLGLLFAWELACGWLQWDAGAWRQTPPTLLLSNGATALFFGFSEELLFRGFVFQTLRRGLPLPAALLLSAAFYAQVHFLRFDVVWSTLALPWLGLFLAGLILAWATYRTRSLQFAVGLHSAWVYLFFLSDRQRLFQYPASYHLLNGSGYPLAGLAALFLLLLLAWVLAWRLSPRQQGAMEVRA